MRDNPPAGRNKRLNQCRNKSTVRHAMAALAVALGGGGFIPPAGADSLPAGPGREQVQTYCTACHGTNLIPRSAGYDRSGWYDLTATMIDLSAVPEDRAVIADYLATHFPPNDRRTPVIIPAKRDITFTEWVVPTLGQRPRDPVQAQDGAVWWAGQWGNLIGRIDPASGEMTEYPMPAGAHPHTVTVDTADRVWYTGNRNGTVGVLDPSTGDITEYPMPDPAARDPHSAIFDAEGILWFTLQHSNMIGRLDPVTGAVSLTTAPSAKSKPYGIKIDADGVPWVACNGRPCLLRVDRDTMDVREVALPTPGTTVRRLDIADDGTIWYVNSGQGRLGHYDPDSGKIREWPSPSGAAAHPYAIAVIDGIVWYNESGMRPDTLVRFDPEAESFESWAIPSGGVYAGIVRHMRATADGNLLIHQSGTNRIMLVTIKP